MGLVALCFAGAFSSALVAGFVQVALAVLEHHHRDIAAAYRNSASFESSLLTAIFELALALPAAVLLPALAGRSWHDLGLRWPTPGGWGLAAGGLAVSYAFGYCYEFFAATHGMHHHQAGFEVFKPAGWREAAVAYAVTVAVAPACEELLCRGLIFGALQRWTPTAFAALASGSIFAGLHLDAFVFAPLLVTGITTAYVYRRTGSIVAPIALHATNNAIATTFLIRHGGS